MNQVSYCGNEAVAEGLLLSLLSYREKSDEPLLVYLITADFTSLSPAYRPLQEKERAFYEKILQEKNRESRVILLDEGALFLKEFASSPNLDTAYTPYSMLRMLFDLEPRLPDRLVYLDADTVVEKDPCTLFRLDLDGNDRAMVPDAVFSKVFDPHYCNSGVILFDLKAIRRDGLLKEGRHLLNTHKFTMPDQEALNRCQKEKILLLPRIYNEQRELGEDTIIRHYCQQIRPLPLMHIEKSKPWDGEKFLKGYPNEPHEELLKLFALKKKLLRKD